MNQKIKRSKVYVASTVNLNMAGSICSDFYYGSDAVFKYGVHQRDGGYHARDGEVANLDAEIDVLEREVGDLARKLAEFENGGAIKKLMGPAKEEVLPRYTYTFKMLDKSVLKIEGTKWGGEPGFTTVWDGDLPVACVMDHSYSALLTSALTISGVEVKSVA